MKIFAAATLATMLAALAAPGFAQSSTSSTSIPASALKFGPAGVKDASGKELYVAAAYGDMTRGPHGTFVRTPAGFSSLPHGHTGDYWGVVVSGVVVNGKPGSPDVRLPAGSYWFQKGGEDHVTKCVSSQPCVFFVSQQGGYDYVPEEPRK